MKNIDIYPGFYIIFSGTIVNLISVPFCLLMFVPYIFDTSTTLTGILFFNKTFVPLYAFILYGIFIAFILNPFTKQYVKPLRINEHGIFIPDWVMDEKFIVSKMDITCIELIYYRLRSRKRRYRKPVVFKMILYSEKGTIELLLNDYTASIDLMKKENFYGYKVCYKEISNFRNVRLFTHASRTRPFRFPLLLTVLLVMYSLAMDYMRWL